MQRFQNRYRIDSVRWGDHDYDAPGWYFVTICTKNRAHFFGQVRGGVMGLSPAGCIAAQEWRRTPQVRPRVRLGAWVVMPNHVHGLIGLAPRAGGGDGGDAGDNGDGGDNGVETLRRNVSTGAGTGCDDQTDTRASKTKNERMAAISPDAGSLPVVVRAYKSVVTRRVRRGGCSVFAWQARYHDRVVRDAPERRRIRRYIRDNPRRWSRDRNHPER